MAFYSTWYRGIRISAHAQQRACERTQIGSLQRLCEMAHESLTEGIDALGDPALRELCLGHAERNGSCGMYAHKGVVFIFKEETLTTIYPIAWLANFDSRGRVVNRVAA